MELMKRSTNLWEPLDLLADLQEDWDRVLNRSLAKRQTWSKTFSPTVEVKEETDHYILHADLPGLQKEDFSIAVEGNTLTLKGERKEEKESKENGARYTERVYGAFSRVLDFPTEIEAGQVKAAFKNGVLEITLPKSEKSKPKKVDVEIK